MREVSSPVCANPTGHKCSALLNNPGANSLSIVALKLSAMAANAHDGDLLFVVAYLRVLTILAEGAQMNGRLISGRASTDNVECALRASANIERRKLGW